MSFKGFASYLFFGLLILQYQNCAPSSADLSGESALNQPDTLNSQVEDKDRSTIDRIQVGALFFPQKSMDVDRRQENLNVIGVCEQSGSIIGWTLRAADGTLVERGRAQCDRGSFAVELGGDWRQECGALNLKAALGAKAASEVTLVSDCAFESENL